jgi:hypothetical protein
VNLFKRRELLAQPDHAQRGLLLGSQSHVPLTRCVPETKTGSRQEHFIMLCGDCDEPCWLRMAGLWGDRRAPTGACVPRRPSVIPLGVTELGIWL